MSGKFFLIDTIRCIACRGCQIACKQWNKLPAAETEQYGSYQNPANLDGNTYRLVRFAEHTSKENTMVWYFFTDSCRHCLNPPCKNRADQIVKDAIIVNNFGAVIFTDKTSALRNSWKVIKHACPWSIPNWSEDKKQLTKCHMCHDRVEAGLLPACVKACSTEALMFGDEKNIKEIAAQRLNAAGKRFGDRARILDHNEVRALYLVVDDYEMYLTSE
jgi:formate dehydrogenase iron-sulfur subunit